MPSSAGPGMAAVAMYGLADGSTTLTSTLAPRGLAAPAGRNRTAASRFSVPQHVYAPDQLPGVMRRPDRIDPHKTPWACASEPNTPATADAPSVVIPPGPSPPENSGVSPRVNEKCWCAPDPTLPANGTGDRLTRSP